MRTVSLNVENLCVPCSCRCRHCLLGFDGGVPGAGYERGKELGRRYGDEDSDRLFRYRDLVLLWTRRYVKDSGLTLHDMTDERGHFSAWV